jgi:hypothetical protein
MIPLEKTLPPEVRLSLLQVLRALAVALLPSLPAKAPHRPDSYPQRRQLVLIVYLGSTTRSEYCVTRKQVHRFEKQYIDNLQ